MSFDSPPPYEQEDDDLEDGTLFEKMSSDEEADEDVRRITKDEMKRLVFALLEKRPSATAKYMLGSLSQYRVDGQPITELELTALKQDWFKAKDVESRAEETKAEDDKMVTKKELTSEKALEIDKRYQIYKEMKQEDPELAKLILVDGFGLPPQKPSAANTPPPPPRSGAEEFIDTFSKMKDIMKDMGMLKDNKGGDSFDEMDKWMNRLDKLGMLRGKDDHNGAFPMYNGMAISSDPDVAIPQVVGMSLDHNIGEINNTLREAFGLRRVQKEEKLLNTDKKKIESQIKQLEEMGKQYGFCLNCSVAECSHCKIRFHLKGQDPTDGQLECPKCGTMGEHVQMVEPTFIPKTAQSCAKCGTVFSDPNAPTPPPAPVGAPKGRRPRSRKDTEPDADENDEEAGEDEEIDLPEEAQPEQSNEVEVITTPEMDSEVLKWIDPEDGNLVRLKRKIEGGHDPIRTAAGTWNWAISEDIDNGKYLLFIAEKGPDFMAELVKPYVDRYKVHELYEFYQQVGPKQFIKKMLDKFIQYAKDENIVLTDEDRKAFEDNIAKSIAGLEPPTPDSPLPPVKGSIPIYDPKNQKLCDICGAVVSLEDYQKHIDLKHPPGEDDEED